MPRNVVLIAVAIVVVVAGFVVASGDKKKSSSAGPVKIVIKNAKPVGGITNIKVNKGDRVRFSVTSDVADEVHVHGYNFHKNVAKGGAVSFDFPAKIDGEFEAELESRKEQILALTVQP